jgi:hypothetical protein
MTRPQIADALKIRVGERLRRFVRSGDPPILPISPRSSLCQHIDFTALGRVLEEREGFGIEDSRVCACART